MGYQLPEYTAYDQMLSVFRRLVPIPSALSADDNYKLHMEKLKENIDQMGLSVIFASNPRNPTGQAIEGEELKELVEVSRNGQTIVLDEFYSWYNLDGTLGESLSAAKYIKSESRFNRLEMDIFQQTSYTLIFTLINPHSDVNKDAVVLIDGLTKNWSVPLP